MPNPVVVNIFITGICYIATSGTTPNVISVVMPDATMARVAKAKDASGQHPVIPEHRAFIAVRHDQIQNDNTGITGTDHLRAYIEGVDTDVFLLNHEQISLIYDRYNASSTLTFGAGDGNPTPTDPPDQVRRFDYTTLVDLKRDACGACRPLPGRYVRVTSATKAAVAARLDIDDGVVSAAFVNPKRTWAFTTSGSDRPLPQEVAVDIATKDGKLTLRLDELTTTNAPGTLDLVPTTGRVSVVVGNSTLANILHVASPMDLDVHFEHYYDLLASSPGQNIPHTVKKHPGGANCPPAAISYQ